MSKGEEGGEWDDFSESQDSHDDRRRNDNDDDDRSGSRSFTPKKNYSDNYRGGRDREGDRYRGGDRRGDGGYGRGGRGGRGGYERRPPRNASKNRILSVLEEIEDAKSYWLNLFEVDADTTEDTILDFFAEIPCLRVEWHRNGKNSMDVEFETLKHLEEAIDMCQKLPEGLSFFIRSSFKNERGNFESRGGYRGGRGDRDFRGERGRGRGGRGGNFRDRGDRDFEHRGRDEGGYNSGRGGRGGRNRDRDDFEEGQFDRRPKRRFEDNQYGTLVKPGSGANDKDQAIPNKGGDKDIDPIEELRKRKGDEEKFDKKISKRGPRSGDFEEAESMSREKKKRSDPIPVGNLTRGDKPSMKAEPKAYVPSGTFGSKFSKDRDDFNGNSDVQRKDSKNFKTGDWNETRGPKKDYVPHRGGRGGFKSDNFRKPSDWEDKSGGHKGSYNQDTDEKPRENQREGFRKNSGFGDKERGDFDQGERFGRGGARGSRGGPYGQKSRGDNQRGFNRDDREEEDDDREFQGERGGRGRGRGGSFRGGSSRGGPDRFDRDDREEGFKFGDRDAPRGRGGRGRGDRGAPRGSGYNRFGGNTSEVDLGNRFDNEEWGGVRTFKNSKK